jgi:hypothetical protein
MKKIRSLIELQDCIDEEMAWRKKELTALKVNVKEARNFAQNTAIRSGIALLYAHWEGAIKNIATCYLCYISSLKLPYQDLKKNFFALSIKKELNKLEHSKKISIHTNILGFIFSKSKDKSEIPFDRAIKTRGNLDSELFKEIMETIGLDYSQYECDFKLIDEVLLNMRNKIAHGEVLVGENGFSDERFYEIHTKIMNLIQLFSTQISNAASQKEYCCNTKEHDQ